MDVYWAEVADHIEAIEELYEDEKFPNRELAAMVASKVNLRPEPASAHHSLPRPPSRGTLPGHIRHEIQPPPHTRLEKLVACLCPRIRSGASQRF